MERRLLVTRWASLPARLAVMVCAWLLVCLLPLPLLAHQPPVHYAVSHWDTEDGLPHNLIHAVAQDRHGFIWAVTWEGVVRFNGRGFIRYDNENAGGALLSGVFSVIAEADGSILVGTAHDGIYRFDQGRWTALYKSTQRHHAVEHLLRTADGHLWFSSREKLSRLSPDGTVETLGAAHGLAPGYIHGLTEVDGRLLVATSSGAWQWHEGRFQRWGPGQELAGKAIRQIIDDRRGGWILLGSHTIWQWHADGQLEQLEMDKQVESVLVDRHGALWVSLVDGQVLRRMAGQPELSIRLEGLATRALMEDSEGLIWIGNSTGLYQLVPATAAAYTPAQGLGGAFVRVVMQNRDGTVWIGHTEGLDLWKDGHLAQVPIPSLQGHGRTVTALARDEERGGMWLGTFDQGVWRMDRDARPVERVVLDMAGARSPMVRAILPVPGGLLAGTSMGLLHVSGGEVVNWTQTRNLPVGDVYAIVRDGRGVVWVGMSDGMASIDAEGTVRRWYSREDIPATSVFDFHHDPDGTVWVASDSGVLRLVGDRVVQYDHRAGLPRDKVFRIIDDGRGHFWLSSNQGVFRVSRDEFQAHDRNPGDLLQVHVVDSSDGMPSSQVNGATWPSGWHLDDGSLMYPTSKGVARVDPGLLERRAQRKPPVVFEQVHIDGQLQSVKALHRLPQGASRLTISYVALAYAAPRKLRYRYRLQGFDEDWMEVGESTEAVYTNLPPGSYRFQVQAMPLPLDWEDAERVGMAELHLVQEAGWWQKPSVWVGIGLLMMGAAWSWLFVRARRFSLHQARLNALVEARTSELNQKNAALQAADREREDLMALLARQAFHDALTGLPNRRAADGQLQQACEQARETGRPLCVALLDVDHFKQVNDTHGHDVGDQVLQLLGTILREYSGGSVFTARQGGEEFLVLLQDMSLEQAVARLNLLRATVEASELPGPLPIRFTVSVGVAAYGPGQSDQRSLLSAADACLYQAKRTGRNRVVA